MLTRSDYRPLPLLPFWKWPSCLACCRNRLDSSSTRRSWTYWTVFANKLNLIKPSKCWPSLLLNCKLDAGARILSVFHEGFSLFSPRCSIENRGRLGSCSVNRSHFISFVKKRCMQLLSFKRLPSFIRGRIVFCIRSRLSFWLRCGYRDWLILAAKCLSINCWGWTSLDIRRLICFSVKMARDEVIIFCMLSNTALSSSRN